MARIRTIKPEFFTDEKLSECSVSARLLFVGLWCFSDDSGRKRHEPARIRMEVFPCGSVSLDTVRECLDELRIRGLIRVYVIDFIEYLDIPGFADHQRINRPTPSRLPAFVPSGLREPSVNAHGGLTESSRTERKGKERKGKEEEEEAQTLAPVPGLDEEAWARWVEYRSAIRKPLKAASHGAARQALAQFGKDQSAVVTQSIAAGWQGLFPLKQGQGQGQGSTAPLGRYDRIRQQQEAALAAAERQEEETFP